jgi:hypothetical protein
VTAASGIQKRKWRAPQADGAILESPPLTEAGEIAARNHAALEQSAVLIDGRPLAELRAEVRKELFGRHQQSRAAQQQCSCAPRSPEGLWFVTGHQPVLAHPGVWVKNIAAAALARDHGGIGLNLVVDNDLVNTRSIAVPRGTHDEPRLATVPFDENGGIAPWEEARIKSFAKFEDFGRGISDSIEKTWGYSPMLRDVWPSAVAAARDSGCLITGLSAVRTELERRHGLGNCESRISRMAQSTAFLHFVRHLAANAEQFRESHNRRLAEYRRLNRVRSHSHPVAALAANADRFELPLWAWRKGESIRRRVFATHRSDRIELSDGQSMFATFGVAAASSAQLDPLLRLADQGIRLRPRALATTLFSRLIIADVFLHGIGGAKYDELSDAIGRDFFGIEMPEFITLTGTWRLPLGAAFDSAKDDWLRAQRQIRDARYNAERIADLGPNSLVNEKIALVDELDRLREPGRSTRRQRREVATRIRRAEESLARSVADRVPAFLVKRSHAEQQIAANRILRNREFAAVLHPAESYAAWVKQVRSAMGS